MPLKRLNDEIARLEERMKALVEEGAELQRRLDEAKGGRSGVIDDTSILRGADIILPEKEGAQLVEKARDTKQALKGVIDDLALAKKRKEEVVLEMHADGTVRLRPME